MLFKIFGRKRAREGDGTDGGDYVMFKDSQKNTEV